MRKKISHQRSTLKKALAGKVSSDQAHLLLEKEPEMPEVSVWYIQPDGLAINSRGEVKTKEEQEEDEKDPNVQVITIGGEKQNR